MAPTFQLTLVSAAGKAFTGEVEAVVLPGVNGSFGILAQHAPLISALEQGLAKITVGGVEKFYMVGDGYVEVANNEAGVIVGEAFAVKDRETGLKLLADPRPWEAAAALAEQEENL
ncbi:MAG TPA: ATP synthase F1 subunit epsilon [Kiritimatiellia bacterium]|nr:ATP synthase F1 subunit epsilon [Kiritimatiellia bacterium]HMO99682.1 ATP synthase F1 subunit epsilon [Kiritimatiellia bacterium]HMP96144.1 ATP synthase F1 subunit epsilon [Kiritimatiellia bacterium]